MNPNHTPNQSGIEPCPIQNNPSLVQQLFGNQQQSHTFRHDAHLSPTSAPNVVQSQQHFTPVLIPNDSGPSAPNVVQSQQHFAPVLIPNDSGPSKHRRKPLNEKRSSRPPNWKLEEDIDLCKAWIRISTDQIVGIVQERQSFWMRVCKDFVQRRGGDKSRNEQACESRWGLVHPWVTKWTEIWKQSMEFKPSGFTIEDQERSARSLFLKKYKQHFKYEHCWITLRSCSKWQQYSAESKAGVELGFNKQGPYVDPMAELHVGGSQGAAFDLGANETRLPENCMQIPLPKTPVTDCSPFEASNGNEGTDELQRPVGSKAAKAARARKKSSKNDASSQVSDSINAGFMGIIENSHRDWDSYVKSMEGWRRIRKEDEEERLLSMVVKKSKIYKNRATIIEKLISSKRQLRSMAKSSLTDSEEIEEFDQLKQLVEDLECQLEELRQVSMVDVGSRSRATPSKVTPMRLTDVDCPGSERRE